MNETLVDKLIKYYKGMFDKDDEWAGPSGVDFERTKKEIEEKLEKLESVEKELDRLKEIDEFIKDDKVIINVDISDNHLQESIDKFKKSDEDLKLIDENDKLKNAIKLLKDNLNIGCKEINGMHLLFIQKEKNENVYDNYVFIKKKEFELLEEVLK